MTNDLLALVHIAPPVGEKWSAHSLRSGGASASLAIGVTLFFIMKYGVWRSLAAVQRYLSHLVVLPISLRLLRLDASSPAAFAERVRLALGSP